MRIVIFCHSLISDWNHGNAHFLRGLMRALQARGHSTICYEPVDGWSLTNLLRANPQAIEQFTQEYPDLAFERYTAEPELVDWVRDTCGWVLEIVKRSDDVTGFQVLPKRWIVERTFAWLGRYRRLSKDYEALPASEEAWIYLATTNLLLRRLAR